jgi:predicted enzyme related to lactoylglutathione lyase
MANVDKHAPGSFAWLELATSDQNAAKGFYQSLFGWTANDFPMGPAEFYTMFQLEGRDCAAGYTLKEEMRSQGIPPHWDLYMAVESADDTAAKVTEAGGKVIAPPIDVMDFGRMAVLQDPTGAVFCIWQAKQHPGTSITSVPGTLCWADLMSPDPAAAAKFYHEVFGWAIAPGENDPSGYLHIKNGTEFIGGIPPAEHRPPNVPPHWMLYIFVTDCAASSEKAKELGGNVLLAPMDIMNVGSMSIVADPQGAAFALFTPTPHTQA